MANETKTQVLVSTQFFVVNNPALPQYQTDKALQRAAKSYGKITPPPFLQPKPIKPQPIDDDTPGGGGESTAKDYFIGWTTGSKADFAALTAAQLQALATGYTTAQNPSYTGQFGQNRIFFLLYKSAPQRIVLTSSGQEMVQNIEQDNTCPHDPVTIDGTTYQLFGIFASSQHDASDSMTITF